MADFSNAWDEYWDQLTTVAQAQDLFPLQALILICYLALPTPFRFEDNRIATCVVTSSALFRSPCKSFICIQKTLQS